jgi:hypothetical protein
MTTQLVTKRKWFWAWQDEKEEDWLAEMARQGLILDDVPLPGSYQFIPGEPADYVYRLDYQSLKTKDKDSYLQLFSDAGWEQVGEMGGWMYFRHEGTQGEAPEIYSDLDSKIGKYQRVMLFLVILLPIILMLLNNTSFGAGQEPFSMIVQGLAGLLLLLYTFAMIQLFIRINKLKKNS